MLNVRPFQFSDLEAIRRFTDHEIGAGYYSSGELEDIFHRSQKNGLMCSFLIESPRGEIKGVRISYPPGQWSTGKGKGLNPESWPHALAETAYFQSLFLAGDLQGQGWGGKLSAEAIRTLQRAGAKGIVCHSWKESPNDSSNRYLRKLGFELVAEHPKYWKGVPYRCTLCGDPPCQCTAHEMYLDLNAKGVL